MSGLNFFKVFLIGLSMLLASDGLFAAGVASDKTAVSNSPKKEDITGKGPIVITSEALSSDKKNNTALFEGKVVAKTEKMTLYADRMAVYYKPGGGEVEKIEADGNVRLVKGNQVITSGKAVYYQDGQDGQKVVFTVRPKAVEGGDVMTGSKMTYLIDEERSIVENSKVFLERK